MCFSREMRGSLLLFPRIENRHGTLRRCWHFCFHLLCLTKNRIRVVLRVYLLTASSESVAPYAVCLLTTAAVFCATIYDVSAACIVASLLCLLPAFPYRVLTSCPAFPRHVLTSSSAVPCCLLAFSTASQHRLIPFSPSFPNCLHTFPRFIVYPPPTRVTLFYPSLRPVSASYVPSSLRPQLSLPPFFSCHAAYGCSLLNSCI